VSGSIAACSAGGGGSSPRNSGSGGNGSAGIMTSGGTLSLAGSGGTGVSVDPVCTQACQDFPADPIYVGVTSGETGAFSGSTEFTPDAYCVSEPQLSSGAAPGAMFPRNWLAPRFRWQATAGDDLFELRISHPVEANDLVVYTRDSEWTLPQEIWLAFASNAADSPVTVTIRGTGTSAGFRGATGTFNVAPVEAGGTMVFWASASKEVTKDASYLLSFNVGSASVARALDLYQVATSGIVDSGGGLRNHGKVGFAAGEVQCIGCHVSTPDGSAVVFSDDWPWNKVIANVDPDQGAIGSLPPYVSSNALGVMNMPWQSSSTLTKNHWSDGERIIVTALGGPRSAPFDSNVANSTDYHWTDSELIWMDVGTAASVPQATDLGTLNPALTAAEGTAWGTIATDGDPGAAVLPNWSHDGLLVTYTSTRNPTNGHLSKTDASTPADIYIVPYNDRAGGPAKPVEGAADPTFREYYPAFSPDDQLIAFNRVETMTSAPYYNSDGEIWIVPKAGGAPTRLAANDPPACTGELSPGITNSWPRWSPSAQASQGKTYYFLVFSSARLHDGQFDLPDPYDGLATVKSSHLYMAAVVVDDASGSVTTYPAVYLWNQNRVVDGVSVSTVQTSNLTPAWDEFKIPPPIVQ